LLFWGEALSFFPSQRDALKNGILSERTTSLQMPTSSGKTFLTELIIYNSIKENNSNKILYLTPFRSLAAELKKSLAKNLRSLGIIAKTIYGGNLPNMDDRQGIDESNVLISTPEKFMAMENVIPGLNMMYSTIICDEGHLLDDENRGLQYELLLARMISNQRSRRFIFISAIVPNMEIVNKWLGGTNETIVKSNYRPTQLDYAFLYKNSNTSYFLDFNPGFPSQFQLYKFLTEDDLILKKAAKSFTISTKAGLTIATAMKAIHQGSVLIFSPQVGGTIGVETLANEAIKQISYKEDDLLVSDHTNLYKSISI
jgi:Lhr-like helicase